MPGNIANDKADGDCLKGGGWTESLTLLYTRSWQVTISFPVRKFLFLFPPQNLIVLSGVLFFFHLYFSLALVLFVFFPHSFLLFPFLLRYFFLFFVIFATFPHRHIFPQLFPYNLCLTDLRTVWQPRFQVWEFEVKCGVVTNNLHCLLQHFYVICPRIGINSSKVVVDY
jgi:hypothetical protein